MKYLGNLVGSIVISIALICLAGYLFDKPALVSIIPGMVTMKIWTAFAVLLAGTHAFLEATARRNGTRDGLAYTFAMALSMIEAALFIAALIVFFDGHGFVFSHAGYSITAISIKYQFPSMVTAFSLLVYGATSLRSRFRVIGSHILIAVASSALIGYATHTPELYFLWNNRMTPVAINTATCLLLLGIYLRTTVICTVKRKRDVDTVLGHA